MSGVDLEAAPLFDAVNPERVRYIKLGVAGCWEDSALSDDRLYWGNGTDPVHEAALGQWDEAEQRYRDMRDSKSSASNDLRELRDFFTLDADTLWITFTQGMMWWAFSAPAEANPDSADSAGPTAFRRTIGPWRNTDRFGRPLVQSALSSKLTQLAAYRRSICDVKPALYAIRRINGEADANAMLAQDHRRALIDAASNLVRDLHWRDFELLVDLIFANAGWRRISEVGGTMKDIDLLLEQPVTGERISVQVKSAIDQKVASGCVEAFAASEVADRFFVIFHTGGAIAGQTATDRPVHFWDCLTVAERAVDAGLTNWLLARTE